MQVPDFALVILCALGNGGGKENENDVSGITVYTIYYCNLYNITYQ